MIIVKKKSFDTKYSEECIQKIEFNEKVNTVSKFLDFLDLDIEHTAVKINNEEIPICKDKETGNIKNDSDISDSIEIKLFILPDSPDFYYPTLLFYSDGEIHKMKKLKNYNQNFFNFPNEVLNKKTCGDKYTHEQRSEGAIRNLKNPGFLEQLGGGNYKITDKGLQLFREYKRKSQSELKKYIFVKSDLESKHNLIYFGAPGTGKSHTMEEDKNKLLGDEFKENYERITFHPDYSYANFVGTYKPVSITNKEIKSDEENQEKENRTISYDYVPGPFMRVLVNALKHPKELFLLIIEEINRANVSAVFGDVFQLLDRNIEGEHLRYASKFPINCTEDMKRYLKKELSDEKQNDEMKIYLDEALGENFNKLIIPKNMYIWATMNSADQGVFPMDTAFKRRWDFKHFRVYQKYDEIKNKEVNVDESWNVKNNKIQWNELRDSINDELLKFGINEDKLIGPFFAFNKYDKSIPFEDFKEIFKNKIIMYLFEDAARYKSDKLFSGVEGKNIYSQICDEFDDRGIEIFCKNIRSKFIEDNNE